MAEYTITPENKTKKKRLMIIVLAVNYLIVMVLTIRAVLYNNLGWVLLALIIVALIAAYFYNIKKYFKDVDSTKLIIDENAARLIALNRAEKLINFKDMKSVEVKKNGFSILTDNRSKPFFISDSFEDYDEIQDLIQKKINS
jgi:hypothetical protein